MTTVGTDAAGTPIATVGISSVIVRKHRRKSDLSLVLKY
jgi:hypothetical protein